MGKLLLASGPQFPQLDSPLPHKVSEVIGKNRKSEGGTLVAWRRSSIEGSSGPHLLGPQPPLMSLHRALGWSESVRVGRGEDFKVGSQLCNCEGRPSAFSLDGRLIQRLRHRSSSHELCCVPLEQIKFETCKYHFKD